MAWAKDAWKKYKKYKAGEKSRLTEKLEKEKLRADIRKYKQQNRPKPGSGGGFFGGIGFDPTGQGGKGMKSKLTPKVPVKTKRRRRKKSKKKPIRVVYYS